MRRATRTLRGEILGIDDVDVDVDDAIDLDVAPLPPAPLALACAAIGNPEVASESMLLLARFFIYAFESKQKGRPFFSCRVGAKK